MQAQQDQGAIIVPASLQDPVAPMLEDIYSPGNYTLGGSEAVENSTMQYSTCSSADAGYNKAWSPSYRLPSPTPNQNSVHAEEIDWNNYFMVVDSSSQRPRDPLIYLSENPGELFNSRHGASPAEFQSPGPSDDCSNWREGPQSIKTCLVEAEGADARGRRANSPKDARKPPVVHWQPVRTDMDDARDKWLWEEDMALLKCYDWTLGLRYIRSGVKFDFYWRWYLNGELLDEETL